MERWGQRERSSMALYCLPVQSIKKAMVHHFLDSAMAKSLLGISLKKSADERTSRIGKERRKDDLLVGNAIKHSLCSTSVTIRLLLCFR